MAGKNKLAKLLLEDQTVDGNGSGNFNKFGVDEISNVHETIAKALHAWDPNHQGYDPLVEIAKLGISTDSEDLRFRCHAEIAKYKYPQIRSLEIQAKQNKEIKINIEIADYARVKDTEIEPEDIEIQGDIDESDIRQEKAEDKKHDYVSDVLEQTKSGKDLG